jgi:hypothetical protein
MRILLFVIGLWLLSGSAWLLGVSLTSVAAGVGFVLGVVCLVGALAE